jgi:predicted RNA-binding protein with PIN domain
VRWLVDGMNVIGSRPTGWWRDRPGAMRTLVEELGAFAERSGDPVTVVLDGKPFDLKGGAGVTVKFASRRGPNAADDDIAALVESNPDPANLSVVESNPDPANLSVVTSDRDLARRVRDAGATVVGAGEFRRRLDG